MGLDMSLSGKIYVGGNYEHNEVKGVIDIEKRGEKLNIDLKKLEYVELHIAYRRKANAIHKWFVDNVQDGNDDCGNYFVSYTQLKELVGDCKKVLSSLEKQEMIEKEFPNKRGKEGEMEKVMVYPNTDLAMELLPPQEGFFFGNTYIDELYVEDLKNTITQLEGLDYTGDYYYSSSR